MAEAKTIPTNQSVEAYIDQIQDQQVREDCLTLSRLMKTLTGSAPKMWGPNIVGFGKYHYKYPSGHEGEICLIGFSPRKQNISLYVLAGFVGQTELLQNLGKHKAGKGCLYVKALKDIDMNTLESIIKKSIDFLKKKYPGS
jgi:hypothetical protein